MPRVVDKGQRQGALIQAAVAVFAERGYHHATMQDVADRAGVSKGGLYGYFKSKEELLVGTAETLLDAMLEQSIGALEQGERPLRDRLEAFIRSLLDGVDGWTEIFFGLAQVWAELGASRESPLYRRMSDIYRSSADRIQQTFDRSVAAGETPPFATRPATLALMAALDGMLLQAYIVPDQFKVSLESDTLIEWCRALVPEPITEESP